MKFAGVCLVTNDVPKLVDFYSKVFRVEAEGNDVHSVITLGDFGIAIYHPDGLEQPAFEIDRQKLFTLMFEVDDVDEEYERLKQFNIEFVLLPTTQPWGSRAMWFNDPDGNNIDFYTVIKQ